MGLTYGEGYGVHRRWPGTSGPSGYAFEDADAAAYVAAMAVEPPDFIKEAVDQLVLDLKAASLWNTGWLLFLHAVHDEQAARVNVFNPSVVATRSEALDFLYCVGFKGASGTPHLDTGVAAGALDIAATDFAVGSWDDGATDGGQHAYTIGVTGSDNLRFNPGYGTPPNRHIRARLAATGDHISGPATGDASPTPAELWLATRTGTTQQLVRNGVQHDSANITNAGFPAGNITILRANSIYNTSHRISASFVTRHQGGAARAAFSTAIGAYMEAVRGTPAPL